MRASSCCGCCSVKTGVVLIGSLMIIFSAAAIIFFAVYSNVVMAVYVSPIVHFLCGIFLIMGAKNREVQYIFPTVCILFTNLILVFPVVVVHIIQIGLITKQTEMFYGIILPVFAVSFGLTAYFYVVINTFHKELLSEKYTNSRLNRNVDVHYINKPQYL